MIWYERWKACFRMKVLVRRKQGSRIYININAAWGSTTPTGKKYGKGWEFIIILMDCSWPRRTIRLVLSFHKTNIKTTASRSANSAPTMGFSLFSRLRLYNPGMSRKVLREMLSIHLALWLRWLGQLPTPHARVASRGWLLILCALLEAKKRSSMEVSLMWSGSSEAERLEGNYLSVTSQN